jgi:hypothetical protein
VKRVDERGDEEEEGGREHEILFELFDSCPASRFGAVKVVALAFRLNFLSLHSRTFYAHISYSMRFTE